MKKTDYKCPVIVCVVPERCADSHSNSTMLHCCFHIVVIFRTADHVMPTNVSVIVNPEHYKEV